MEELDDVVVVCDVCVVLLVVEWVVWCVEVDVGVGVEVDVGVGFALGVHAGSEVVVWEGAGGAASSYTHVMENSPTEVSANCSNKPWLRSRLP